MQKIITKLKPFLPLYAIGTVSWLIAHWGLLCKKYIFTHDSLYWYGIFHYFAESLQNGFYPFWNPYLHSGEMFFENFSQLSLIDPITIIGIFLGKLIGIKDLLYLYELIVLAKIIVLAAGVQLLLNEIVPGIKKHSYFTFFILILSSFALNSYHQNGAFLVLGYSPFILLFLIKFTKNPAWQNTLLLGYFSGISFQSIVFAYAATFLIIFIVLFFAFRRGSFKVILNNKLKVLAIIAIVICLSAPAWSLLFYQSYIFPYARFLFNPEHSAGLFFKNYATLASSTAATGGWLDILTLGFLPNAIRLYTDSDVFSKFPISELVMYIGVIPFLLGIVGLLYGRNKYKNLFLALLILAGCIFLGPTKYNFVYRILFYILPPLWTIENTHEFANYFLICYIFFVYIGIKTILAGLEKTNLGKFKHTILIGLFIISLVELNIYANYKYPKEGQNATLFTYKKRDSLSLAFQANSEYKLIQRSKSVIPAFRNINPESLGVDVNKFGPISSIEDLQRLYHRYHLHPKLRLNFRALIQREPTAVDFSKNLPYNFMKLSPPTALTYPRFYTDILKSDISEDLKETLLGVNLSPIDFYANSLYLPPEEILNKKNEKITNRVLKHTVIVNEKNTPKSRSSISSAEISARVLKYKPHYIKLEVHSEEDVILLFRDGFHKDWQAKVDSAPQKVFRANYNQKAVFLRKGKHNIEFAFRPVIYIVSLYAYAMGSLIIFIVLIYLSLGKNRFGLTCSTKA